MLNVQCTAVPCPANDSYGVRTARARRPMRPLGQPLARREIPGGKQENTVSRNQGHFWGEKARHPKSFSPELRNFFILYVLANRTPTGGKSRNTRFLGHFGLGQPLALREIPGRKQKTTNSLIGTEKRETNPSARF